MTTEEYNAICQQGETLRHLMPIYSGKTIDNVLTQLNARLKEYKERTKY